MRIYTRTGDQGQTSLFSGERVDKDALRVEAYGTLDELNSLLGLALSFVQDERVRDILESLQHTLFAAGADLATRSGGRRQVERLREQDWRRLEGLIDDLDARLPPLRNFILPGGSPGGALLQLARTVCRRAERLVVRLGREEGDVNPDLLVFLNRLSDFLFVMGRYVNAASSVAETPWRSGR